MAKHDASEMQKISEAFERINAKAAARKGLPKARQALAEATQRKRGDY